MKLRKLSTVSLAVLFSVSLLNSSCDKVKDAIKVNIPLQQAEIQFDLPPVAAGTHTLAQFQVRFDVDSAIRANASQFSAKNIKSVKLEGLKITASNTTAEDNFGVLSACTAKLSADVNSNLITIGELNNNPDAAASTLTIPVNKDQELKDYFSGKSFSYILSGTARRATTTTLHCKGTIDLNIEVGL
jgi:hypothetical protein